MARGKTSLSLALAVLASLALVSARPEFEDFDYANNEVSLPEDAEQGPNIFEEPEEWEEWTFITVMCTDDVGLQHEECQRVYYGHIDGYCEFMQLGCYERLPSKKNEA